MRISIDSTEPLQDVIRVVGAMYKVTLTVATTNEAATTSPVTASADRGGSRTGSKASRARGNARGRSGSRGRSDKRLAKISNDELRSWARQNGHVVRDRGRIPAAVVTAYHEAQRG